MFVSDGTNSQDNLPGRMFQNMGQPWGETHIGRQLDLITKLLGGNPSSPTSSNAMVITAAVKTADYTVAAGAKVIVVQNTGSTNITAAGLIIPPDMSYEFQMFTAGYGAMAIVVPAGGSANVVEMR